MKNNNILKRYLILNGIIIILFLFIIIIIFQKLYTDYTLNINYTVNGIIGCIIEKYPKVDKNDLVTILNNSNNQKKDLLQEYGISLQYDNLILTNDDIFYNYAFKIIITVIILGIILIACFLLYNHQKNRTINEITKYLEEINHKNYKLDINSNTEEELSILKNEIYKITVMLKEQAENSKQDKLSLKQSLEDISHQLKTPLTSINIMLDNLIDEELDDKTRNEFMKDISREVNNINCLILSLLKLSKFDANTVSFDNETFFIKDLLQQVLKNVDMLRDLKNVNIIVNGDNDARMNGDFLWQKEALTNILKNGIEHSHENGQIEINYEENKIYSKITIKDYGIGISKKDLPHIFERFYKGSTSSNDSIGIGLALAKTIINNNNGSITVSSIPNVETTFTIKYMK